MSKQGLRYPQSLQKMERCLHPGLQINSYLTKVTPRKKATCFCFSAEFPVASNTILSNKKTLWHTFEEVKEDNQVVL